MEELGAYQPRDTRPTRDPDDDHHVEDGALLHQGHQGEDEEEAGDADHHLDETGDQHVHPSPEIAGESTQYDADQYVDRHGHHADGERDAGAVEHPHQHVTALEVRPQPEAFPRRPHAALGIRLTVVDAARREDRRHPLAGRLAAHLEGPVVQDRRLAVQRVLHTGPPLGHHHRRGQQVEAHQRAHRPRAEPTAAPEDEDREQVERQQHQQQVEEEIHAILEDQTVEEGREEGEAQPLGIAPQQGLVHREQRGQGGEREEKQHAPEPEDGGAVLRELPSHQGPVARAIRLRAAHR